MSRIFDALRRAEQQKPPDGFPPETQGGKTPPSPGESTAFSSNVAPTQSPAEVQATGTPIEAILDACPRRDPLPRAAGQPEENSRNLSMLSEEFRSLRSHLILMRKQKSLQRLLITSPLPQEGKTFVTAHLAQALARQRGRRVLMIDGDLRASALHKALGAPQAPGLSEYLSGTCDLGTAMWRGLQDNLFFLAGGERPQNPTELLGNGRLESLLATLTPAFDWIILDSPPVIPVSDAKLLAQLCDGVLMLVQAGRTPFDLAQEACQEFSKTQLLGVVLNRAGDHVGYGYYYSSTEKS